MKLAQSGRTNEIQDLATATLAAVPIVNMTIEMRRWCVWHNARPDRVNLVPIGTNDFITYGGDALMLTEYTGVKNVPAFYGNLKIAIAIAHKDQIEKLTADLLVVGIALAVIPGDDEPMPIHE